MWEGARVLEDSSRLVSPPREETDRSERVGLKPPKRLPTASDMAWLEWHGLQRAKSRFRQ